MSEQNPPSSECPEGTAFAPSTACPASTQEVPLEGSPRTWRLCFTRSGKERYRVLHSGARLVLGSGQDADVVLVDPTVSSLHCELVATDEGLSVRDLGSKNGTYVGSGRVTYALLVGSKVSFSIGHTTVSADERANEAPVNNLGLIGSSEAMQRVRSRILRFARLRAPVLVVGESGTGKDLVAQALHRESGRTGPWLPLNVAAVADGLIDAELFGHRRGAFTGAVSDRPGLFEQATGGTLFLDEIAELSPAGQAKLLRVVEDGRVRAVGETEGRVVDVRLVSATCAPLDVLIAQARFRNDLYHRLSHLVLEIPPLRRRVDDIGPLAEHHLARIAEDVGPKRLHPSTLEVLRRAPWPGNVRELFGVLYRAAALTSEEVLTPGHFPTSISAAGGRAPIAPERARELLDIHGGLSAAARAAGVPRSTLRSVLQRHDSKLSRGAG